MNTDSWHVWVCYRPPYQALALSLLNILLAQIKLLGVVLCTQTDLVLELY